MAPAPGREAARVPVREVFASIQGEGRYAGHPQVLVRLAGCPLRCRWCDTPDSWSAAPRAEARIHTPRSSRTASAWASSPDVARWIAAVDPSGRRAVSVTGGEPLLWPSFLRELAARLGGRRLHLETAAPDPAVLAAVLDVADHTSLDLKLPADLDPPVAVAEAEARAPAPRDAGEWAEVRIRNLGLLEGRDACGKIVVAGGRAPAEFAPLLDEVRTHLPELPLFLQPATAVRGVAAPAPALLDLLVTMAEERGLNVRVVPQLHRVLGLA
ncbi:MAG: 7-carboxy-7-deazaguanine synthase QueE [Planctomycetota bacterium]